MEETSNAIAPRARNHGLVMRQLPDETLVYDLDRDEAHCLSVVAGLVWSYCDGSTSVAQMAHRLSTDLHAPQDETAVWQALTELDDAQLLEKTAVKVCRTMSRRDMVATMGLVLSAPLITSLVIPTVASASTLGCKDVGVSGCTLSPNNCCKAGTTPTQAVCPSANGTCCFQVGGQPAGFACSANAQCCGHSFCVGGTCSSCIPYASTGCTTVGDCCTTGVGSATLVCGGTSNNKCCTPVGSGNAGKPGGVNCDINNKAQCCSGACNGNFCAA